MEPNTNPHIKQEEHVATERQRSGKQAGFTLIECVCALAIITIGLVGTAAAIAGALKFTRISRNVTMAKTIALSQIEQIHSLRDSRRLTFKQIANVGAVDNTGAQPTFAGFINGLKPMTDGPGTDGVIGTGDDTAAAATSPNRDFSRQIEITNPPDINNLKVITVTVQYPGADGRRYSLTCTSYLNNDLKQ